MEALERRALVMLVVVALLLLRATGLFPTQTWLVAVYIFAPAAYVGRWDSERAWLLFLAFALIVADVVVTALVFAYSAYQTNAHLTG